MMVTLKPCPFCGNMYPEIINDEFRYLSFRYYIQCDRCGAICGSKRTKKKQL